MDKSPEIGTYLDRLNTLMGEALSNHSKPNQHRLLWLIDRRLRQFNLHSQIDPCEILVEAYFRTRTQLLQGKQIKNFSAWLNSVSYKIIQEHSKKEIYRDLLEERLSNNHQHCVENAKNNKVFNEQSITALLRAANTLKEEELEILKLRIVQGYSWKEIRNQWEAIKGQSLSEATLRKKGERALKHLRGEFTSIIHTLPPQLKGYCEHTLEYFRNKFSADSPTLTLQTKGYHEKN